MVYLPKIEWKFFHEKIVWQAYYLVLLMTMIVFSSEIGRVSFVLYLFFIKVI